jgi:hypothetical protein
MQRGRVSGMAPALGASCTVRLPLVPRATLLFPAATVWPSAVMNAGQGISRVPEAGLPSAGNTVSLTVVRKALCHRLRRR